MKKRYLVISIVCLICAVIFALIAIFGTGVLGKKEPEAPPRVETPAQTSEAPEPSASASEAQESAYISPIDFDALHAENPDIYGWLEIPNTDISYPLLQSQSDDTFYLDHDRDGNPDVNGSLFTEHACNGTDFTDPVTPIYGHHMKSGAMFGNLQQIYSDAETYEATQEIVIYLPEREIHYTVFAAVAFDDRHLMYSYDFQTEQGMQRFLNDLAAVRAIGSSYDGSVPVTGDDHLIVLSTCTSGGKGRFLVVAKERND